MPYDHPGSLPRGNFQTLTLGRESQTKSSGLTELKSPKFRETEVTRVCGPEHWTQGSYEVKELQKSARNPLSLAEYQSSHEYIWGKEQLLRGHTLDESKSSHKTRNNSCPHLARVKRLH